MAYVGNIMKVHLHAVATWRTTIETRKVRRWDTAILENVKFLHKTVLGESVRKWWTSISYLFRTLRFFV